MKKRLFSLFLSALLTMAVLGGCGSDGTGESSGNNPSTESVGSQTAVTPGTEAPSVYGGSVVVGIQQDIDSLDPHKATAAGTKEILFNIFEGLVKPDKNGDLMKALASDYSVSEDGLVYTFTLRQGVKFHNGNLVTAEDVKYSLDRVSGLLDGTPLITALSVITDVTIVDAETVQVTVGKANTELIYNFNAAIIPAGSGEAENAQPIGTGPFSFVSYTPQVGIVVKKNADYWQEGLPYLDEVNFKVVNSAETALMELQGGSIQICSYLTDSQAEELKDKFQILAAPSAVVQAIFFNNADPLLQDVRVRQAICYAVDKDLANEFVAGGNAIPISSAMLPTLKSYYTDLNDVYGLESNVEKAKALLTEAGYPNGIDLEITIPSNYEFHMQTGEVIIEQLKEAGINAKINPVEWNTWLDDVYNGRKYQSTICGITGDMTPGYLMNRFQSTSSKNFVNFASEAFDAECAKAVAAFHPTETANPYKEMQTSLTNEAGSAFLMVPPTTVAVSPKLAGYTFYPVYVQDMSTVYYVQ